LFNKKHNGRNKKKNLCSSSDHGFSLFPLLNLFFFAKRFCRIVWGNYIFRVGILIGKKKGGKGVAEKCWAFSNIIIWLLSKRGLSEIGFA